jgi:hypothetical protein
MKVNIGRYKKNGSPRKISVKIDGWDIWSLDHTLAEIIHPALVLLKEKRHGSGMVDDEDVPEKFIDTENENYNNKFMTERYDYILDEMIYAFDYIKNDNVFTGDSKENHERCLNGLRLFGKYYLSLWD